MLPILRFIVHLSAISLGPAAMNTLEAGRRTMAYYTRVLSKDEEFPSFEELSQLIRANHPEFRLTIEEGDEEGWNTLLLSGNDEVEVALIERNPVDGWFGRPG